MTATDQKPIPTRQNINARRAGVQLADLPRITHDDAEQEPEHERLTFPENTQTDRTFPPDAALVVPEAADYGAIVSAAQQDILRQRTPASEVRLRKGKGGRQFRYVDHAYVTKTLNLAFGWAWDFEILETELLIWGDRPFEVRCIGRLTVNANGAQIIKTQCGSQAIEFMSDGSAPVTIGDAYKGAASDALKKCASLLGIALDLYDSDAPVTRKDQLISRITALLDDAGEDELVSVGKFIQSERRR